MAALALFISLSTGAVAVTKLPRNSVGPQHLKANAVRAKHIRNNAVTGAKIKPRTITESDIRTGAITGAHIRDGTIRGNDFRPFSIGFGHIELASLTGALFQPSSIGGEVLEPGAVGPRETGLLPSVGLTTQAGRTVQSFEEVTIAWDSERFDTAAMHNCCSAGMSPPIERISIPRSGIYSITATIEWAPASDHAFGNRFMILEQPGGAEIAHDVIYVDTRTAEINPTVQNLEATAELEAGESVVLKVTQHTMAGNPALPTAVNIVKSSISPTIEATWLGPLP